MDIDTLLMPFEKAPPEQFKLYLAARADTISLSNFCFMKFLFFFHWKVVQADCSSHEGVFQIQGQREGNRQSPQRSVDAEVPELAAGSTPACLQ